MTLLDTGRIRLDFPILDKGVIYLDNAASSLTPEQVVQKEVEFYHEYRANVERGVHRFSQLASQEYEHAHKLVADFLNAASPDCIPMLRNTTEAINFVANSLDWKRGDNIVTTIVEHHSNFITWQRACRRHAMQLRIVKSDPRGRFDLADFEKAIDDKTRVVAVTQASNVLGCVVPVKEIAKIAHEHGAYVLVDGAQSVPHMKTDVREMDVEFLGFSGHKMLGPTGSGGLYIKPELLYNVEPLSIGGGTISEVSTQGYELAQSPMRFEAGTPAIAQVIGLGEAVRYLGRVGMENVEAHERELTSRLIAGLSQIEGVTIYGPVDPKDRLGIVSFNIGRMNPHDVALTLDVQYDIAVRSGHHCALPLRDELLSLDIGTARASMYVYNTREEIDKLVTAVEEISSGTK